MQPFLSLLAIETNECQFTDLGRENSWWHIIEKWCRDEGSLQEHFFFFCLELAKGGMWFFSDEWYGWTSSDTFPSMTAAASCFAKYDNEFNHIKGGNISFPAVCGVKENSNRDLLCHEISYLQSILIFSHRFLVFYTSCSQKQNPYRQTVYF